MGYTFYLSKAEKGAINSGKEVTYFVTPIEVKPHSHPLYISRMIKENADEIGYGTVDGFYENVIAIWSGSVDAEIAMYEEKLAQYSPIRETYIAQYWDAVKKVEQLTEAKRVLNMGLVINSSMVMD